MKEQEKLKYEKMVTEYTVLLQYAACMVKNIYNYLVL